MGAMEDGVAVFNAEVVARQMEDMFRRWMVQVVLNNPQTFRVAWNAVGISYLFVTKGIRSPG